eukprot:56194-Chlamydomonas_euryale.AAC.3
MVCNKVATAAARVRLPRPVATDLSFPPTTFPVRCCHLLSGLLHGCAVSNRSPSRPLTFPAHLGDGLACRPAACDTPPTQFPRPTCDRFARRPAACDTPPTHFSRPTLRSPRPQAC